MFKQGAMVRGDADLGFTRQYAGTYPYLYPIEMQLRWGMGWLLGVLAFAGFFWATWQGILYSGRRFNASSYAGQRVITPGGDASLVLLAWMLPFFLTTGGFYVKFMRYLLPLTPFLMLYAAALIWEWRSRAGRSLVAASVLAGYGRLCRELRELIWKRASLECCLSLDLRQCGRRDAFGQRTMG